MMQTLEFLLPTLLFSSTLLAQQEVCLERKGVKPFQAEQVDIKKDLSDILYHPYTRYIASAILVFCMICVCYHHYRCKLIKWLELEHHIYSLEDRDPIFNFEAFRWNRATQALNDLSLLELRKMKQQIIINKKAFWLEDMIKLYIGVESKDELEDLPSEFAEVKPYYKKEHGDKSFEELTLQDLKELFLRLFFEYGVSPQKLITALKKSGIGSKDELAADMKRSYHTKYPHKSLEQLNQDQLSGLFLDSMETYLYLRTSLEKYGVTDVFELPKQIKDKMDGQIKSLAEMNPSLLEEALKVCKSRASETV